MCFFHSPIFTVRFSFRWFRLHFIAMPFHCFAIRDFVMSCAWMYVYILYFVYTIDRITDSKIDIEINTTENEALKGRSNTVNSNKTDNIDKLCFQEEEEGKKQTKCFTGRLVGWLVFSYSMLCHSIVKTVSKIRDRRNVRTRRKQNLRIHSIHITSRWQEM